MSAEKSQGQIVLENVASWIESFIVFPVQDQALVIALWCINTWMFDAFDSVPYVAITARTKQAGKTSLLEIMGFLSRNGERIGRGTRAETVLSMMDLHGGQCALFFDQAEQLASEGTIIESMMCSGNRKGESIVRKVEGVLVKMKVFGPKCFALIGDLQSDALRDRSILIHLARAIAPRRYRPTMASHEAEAIVAQIKAIVPTLAGKKIVTPDWLDNPRSEDIWEPLVSVCQALGCDAATVRRLRNVSADLEQMKLAPVVRAVQDDDSEAAWEAAVMGERAIADLLSVFKEGERGLPADMAVERMKSLSGGPWRNYRGAGLDMGTLAKLVSPGGVKPSQKVRIVKPGSKAHDNPQARGYVRSNVAACVQSIAMMRTERGQ